VSLRRAVANCRRALRGEVLRPYVEQTALKPLG
jgi:hypothetical protein